MPEQVLWPERRKEARARKRVHAARSALLLLWAAGSAAFAWTLYQVLSVETPTVLQLVFWCLSTACFAWVAVGSASAVIGFIALLLQRSSDTLELPPPQAAQRARTALLFPVYREDATGVASTSSF
jgi:membrane glycosyltransferase